MKYEYYLALIDDAKKVNNKETWIAKYGLPANCPYNEIELTKILNIIFDTAHEDIKEIMKNNGGIATLSKTIRAPYRTVQDWSNGKRKPKDWIIIQIGYVLINIIGNGR